MSKELNYINKKIKDLEFQIAHPTEYNLTKKIKIKNNDGEVYKEELEILKSIRNILEARENLINLADEVRKVK
jgi:DNA-directed RNA polymerase subunit L